MRARARVLTVFAVAGIFVPACQGEIAGGGAGSGGGPGGDGSGGSVVGGSGGNGQGTGGSGGSGGTAGAGGSGGADDGGVADGGPAPTFTELYASVFGTALCAGTLCHNPGMQRAIDLSTQEKAYDSLKFEVVPGNGAGSALYRILADGTMPPDPPKVSPDQLAAIRAWIDAGALNN